VVPPAPRPSRAAAQEPRVPRATRVPPGAASPVVTPTLVKILGGTPLDGVAKLEGGSSEGCAIRADQTLWCWGNSYLNHAAATPAAMPATGVLHVSHGINLNPRYITSDGQFHYNNNSAVRDPYCGQLD